MTKGLAVAFAVGLLFIGAMVWGVFYSKQGAHLVPQASILKVRTQKVEDLHSLIVIDFRLTNNADFPMTIRRADMTVETNGKTTEGSAVSAEDAKKVFTYYPLLGERFNDPLLVRDKVPPRQTVDRMMAFQIDLPYAELEARKKVTMRIEDATGPVVEFSSR